MGYDITKTFYLLPGNGGISREQLAFGHLVKVLEAFANRNQQHAGGIQEGHSFRRGQKIVSGTNVLRPFLNSLYGRQNIIKDSRASALFSEDSDSIAFYPAAQAGI